MVATKTHLAKAEHEAFYQELLALLKKHAGHLDAQEMLAVASNVVGKLIAMQDQRTMTPAMALQIVQENIEKGNRHAMQEISSPAKGSA